MLNPEQLELAARRLCKLRGLDPDENSPDSDEFGFLLERRLWSWVADEITDQWRINLVLSWAGHTPGIEQGRTVSFAPGSDEPIYTPPLDNGTDHDLS